MKFGIMNQPLQKTNADCIVIAVDSKLHLTPIGQTINELTQDEISSFLKSGQFTAKPEQFCFLQNPSELNAKNILMIGCEDLTQMTPTKFNTLINTMITALKTTAFKKVLSTLHDVEIENFDLDWKIKQTIIQSESNLYQFDHFKTKKETLLAEMKIDIYLNPEQNKTAATQSIKVGEAIAHGIHSCKDLGNMPANICTPDYLASEAKKLSKLHEQLSTTVIDESEMKKLGMNVFLAVSQGSQYPGKLIILDYKGTKSNKKPVVIVGKGITFDTGGIDLKPSAGMREMKMDMLGGATVFGIMQAIVKLKLPVNVIGMIAAAENMIGNKATRPTDIIKSMSEQTVEILNTDAEGRLVLCDALTYAKKFNPESVIDIATLTGAAEIALGTPYTALLSNHQILADELLSASQQSNDKAWQLPMDDEHYHDLLKSDLADTANCNIKSREAGTITAACFLSKFTKDFHWAHLDIAASSALPPCTPTGRPVALLVQYLMNKANK